MSTDFEIGLRAAIESSPKRTLKAAKVLRVLDARPSKRRTAKIAEWEQHAIVKFGNGTMIDWESFDFDKFFAALIALIEKLIALFGGL